MLDAFREIRMGCHLFEGVTDATMSHNEAWHFMRLGRMLERADKTSRILDVKYFMLLPSARDVGTPYDDIHWSAVLKSVSGFEMYRKKYGRITPSDVVDFLVMDSEFPRAVRFCIKSAPANRCTRSPARRSAPSATAPSSSWASCAPSSTSPRWTRVIRSGLHEYLDRLQMKMNAIDDSLRDDFAVRTTPAVASQSQTQSRQGQCERGPIDQR